MTDETIDTEHERLIDAMGHLAGAAVVIAQQTALVKELEAWINTCHDRLLAVEFENAELRAENARLRGEETR